MPPEAAVQSDRGDAPPATPLRAWLRRPVAMVVVALVLRLAAMTAGHTYRFNPRQDSFGFGWETGRIARAIAEGEGFSSPFQGRTGPTAWVAPVYPYLVAGIFKVFGIYTPASAWVLLALNSLFSALTCWTMYAIACQTVGARVARWAGWTWALLPYSMYWAIRWVWETSGTAFLLSAAVLVALRLARSDAWREWAAAGALWGVIALANPSCLALLPFALAWPAWQLARARRRWLLPLATAGLVALLAVMPWLVRNYRTFGQFVFIRSNFGAELRMGNSPAGEGLWMFWLHPSQNPVEFARYTRLGEIAYVQARQREALTFMAQSPGRFARLSLRRTLYFWIGTPRNADIPFSVEARSALFLLSSLLAFWGLWLVIRHRRPGAFLYAATLLVYPLPYYLTFPHPRYRHPIEPEMVILGLYLLAQSLRPRPPGVAGEAAAPALPKL